MCGDDGWSRENCELCCELLLSFFVRGLLCVCMRAFPPCASSIHFIYRSPRITRRPHSACGLSFLHLLSYEAH